MSGVPPVSRLEREAAPTVVRPRGKRWPRVAFSRRETLGAQLVSAVIWLLISPFALWASFRAFGIEDGLRQTQLIAFTPYVAALSIGPVIVSALARRWLALLVAAVTFAMFCFMVVPRAVPGQAADLEVGIPLQVMTINLDDGRGDPAAIVRLVADEQIDVLALQELTAPALEALDRAGLRRAMPYRLLPPGTQTQSSIVSRLPIGRYWHAIGSERLPIVMVGPRRRPVAELWGMHPPSLTSEENYLTWKSTMDGIPAPDLVGPPRLLVGDFNATLDHRDLRNVLDLGYVDAADATGSGLSTTWPASGPVPPPVAIDHVLVDPRVEVEEVEVSPVPGSDHHALSASLLVPEY